MKTVIFVIFLCIQFCASWNIKNNACTRYGSYPVRIWSKYCYNNPFVLLDTPTTIERNGYPLEAYRIVTPDGYILTTFRIPPQHNKQNRQPVFLMHGLGVSSGTWVCFGSKSLPYNLADEGYDVWVGTVRGNTFAKTHKYFEIQDKRYWNFSMDSIADYDIAHQLKYIAYITGKAGSIIYIGHSMGTTLSFLYASAYPNEANRLLSGIVALAPVYYLNDAPFAQLLLTIAPFLEIFLAKLEIEGLFYPDYVNRYVINLCSLIPRICLFFMQLLTGKVTDRFPPEELLLFFSHCPSGFSVQILKHYKQFAANGFIQQFEYTMKHVDGDNYTVPRQYDITKIKVPVYLFYGKNDAVGPKKDVERLYRHLGSREKGLYHIPRDGNVEPFNHIDFLLAKDIKQYLYPELFRVMREKLKGN